MNDILRFLELQASFFKGPQGDYCRFIIDQGMEFLPQEPPPGTPYGTPKECYRNATALAGERGIFYVEGYALPPGLLPLPHAWATDREGTLIDNTWRPIGVAYWGVPIQKTYVRDVIKQTGYYSVISNHRIGTPIWKRSPIKWQQKLYRRKPLTQQAA